MWEYKVVSGTYRVEAGNVFVRNPAGEGTLQQVLDHYGAERWELVAQHLDGVHREIVLSLKRPKGGVVLAPVPVAAIVAPTAPAPAPAARFVDADGEVVRRRAPGSPPAGPARGAPAAGGGGRGARRSKAELDRLAREE